MSADAWTRRLLIRICYRIAKKERRRTEVELHVKPDPALTGSTNASADVADREWVLSELARIDVEKRSVIVLHYYLDLPMREVAEILDLPYGTAASRLHRGLELMRASMHGVPGPDSSAVPEQQA